MHCVLTKLWSAFLELMQSDPNPNLATLGLASVTKLSTFFLVKVRTAICLLCLLSR